MSMHNPEDAKREIIIVKRRASDDEEAHHGGVWKIAFADFMTALMCFFLVMWLINAANEETKVAVASYFNPVKLVDRNANRKGVGEPGEAPSSSEQSNQSNPSQEGARRTLSGPADSRQASDASEREQVTDRDLFADPYAVLAEIAAESAMLQNISSKGDGGAQIAGPASGAQGGESYRDPFAPDFWSQQVAAPEESQLEAAAQASPSATAAVEAFPESPPAPELAAPAAEAFLPDARPEPAPEPRQGEALSEAERLAAEIRADLTDAFGSTDALNQTISVTATPAGILISLTDAMNYGMFRIGSAVPQGELVLAMEEIGRALETRSGSISVRGHTDGRPFRSEDYDNWRLSTARAHAAYYMLVRAGLDERRIREVAGFADRRLKVESDPLADVNRRIEILLEPAG